MIGTMVMAFLWTTLVVTEHLTKRPAGSVRDYGKMASVGVFALGFGLLIDSIL